MKNTVFEMTITWIDAKKARPAKSGDYLILMDKNDSEYITLCHYSRMHDAFNVYDDGTEEYEMTPAYWAEYNKDWKESENV